MGENIVGIVTAPVSNVSDVLSAINVGNANRSVGATDTNERSSRSHCILTIMVEGLRHSDGLRTHACLCLVDLAGSERVAKSGAEGM